METCISVSTRHKFETLETAWPWYRLSACLMLKRIRTAESYELHCGLVKNKLYSTSAETVY